MDWLGLLVVQGTLKSLLQHHSSKASILQCSAFCIVQLSQPYMTTGYTIALIRQIFVGKVMSLLFNMLSSLGFGEGNGNPLQCSCLENPRDGGSLVGCHLWGRTELDTTEATQQQQSRLVIAFLPRSKRLLISWLQSPSAVILQPKKSKSLTVSSSICHELIGPDAMILVF